MPLCPDEQVSTEPCASTLPASRSAHALRIFLLEESPGEAELFCHALDLSWGLRESEPESPRPVIDVRCTVQDALDVLKKKVVWEAGLPDLVVLELDLPKRARLKFLREMRKDSHLTNLPVVALGWPDDPAIARTLAGLEVAGKIFIAG